MRFAIERKRERGVKKNVHCERVRETSIDRELQVGVRVLEFFLVSVFVCVCV